MKNTKLSPFEIDFAVNYLQSSDYIDILRTAPFRFNSVRLTAMGRREKRKLDNN